MFPSSDVWTDIRFSYPNRAASAGHRLIMDHLSRSWYSLWRKELWNGSLSCIVATIADASMDLDPIHEPKDIRQRFLSVLS